MLTYRSVAATVALDKLKHPEKYCPATRCLWVTRGGYCPRHAGTVRKPVQSEVSNASGKASAA